MQQLFGTNAGAISPFQYAIPKLYARTTDFRLFDAQAKREKARLESCAYIFKQSKFHQKIPEFVFIGRRQEKAELLSPLFNHKPVQIKGWHVDIVPDTFGPDGWQWLFFPHRPCPKKEAAHFLEKAKAVKKLEKITKVLYFVFSSSGFYQNTMAFFKDHSIAWSDDPRFLNI